MAHGTDINARIEPVDTRRSLPPLDEQHASPTCSARSTTRSTATAGSPDLLEETAATLFRARFVDFVGVEEFDDSVRSAGSPLGGASAH